VIGFVCLGSARAQEWPLKKSYDDGRFTIWYMHWRHGQAPMAAYRHTGPVISVFIGDGTLQLKSGEKQVRHNGDVVYLEPGGDPTAGELLTNAPLNATVIELKDAPEARPIPATVYPPAFPRADATILRDTPKAIIWTGQLRSDQPTSFHLHERNSVTIYTGDAVISRAHPNQAPRQDTRTPGGWEMVHAGFVDQEQAVGAPAHFVSVVLK
jgi:hypothetical protein